ncbi:transposon Ty3-I Gag-Pol polyprotein [Caerostris darwini]|uniref:Transposon Ty3-I Gag-Pol polyprotein n=1 Tax=Caerostris darwini TaxID=1538125 RepID=A0AAV4TDU6_9ARAC|nr:transposon Ty3-I Gag-Pol polyprotein [Caerostris darwini]
MSQVLENCEDFAVQYLDDFAIYSNSWDDHLKHTDEVLKRVNDSNLTIKPSKCKLSQNHTKYLGHIEGSGSRTPAEVKIEAVLDFPMPTTKTQVRGFLGSAGYYEQYVKKIFGNYSPSNKSSEKKN